MLGITPTLAHEESIKSNTTTTHTFMEHTSRTFIMFDYTVALSWDLNHTPPIQPFTVQLGTTHPLSLSGNPACQHTNTQHIKFASLACCLNLKQIAQVWGEKQGHLNLFSLWPFPISSSTKQADSSSIRRLEDVICAAQHPFLVPESTVSDEMFVPLFLSLFTSSVYIQRKHLWYFNRVEGRIIWDVNHSFVPRNTFVSALSSTDLEVDLLLEASWNVFNGLLPGCLEQSRMTILCFSFAFLALIQEDKDRYSCESRPSV